MLIVIPFFSVAKHGYTAINIIKTTTPLTFRIPNFRFDVNHQNPNHLQLLAHTIERNATK